MDESFFYLFAPTAFSSRKTATHWTDGDLCLCVGLFKGNQKMEQMTPHTVLPQMFIFWLNVNTLMIRRAASDYISAFLFFSFFLHIFS